jgi:hypothetical protein
MRKPTPIPVVLFGFGPEASIREVIILIVLFVKSVATGILTPVALRI